MVTLLSFSLPSQIPSCYNDEEHCIGKEQHMTENLSDTPQHKKDSTTRVLYGIIGALVIGIIAVGLFIVFSQLTATPDTPDQSFSVVDQSEFDGTTEISPPRDMPDFTLTNQDGELTSLSDLRGKYVLMTFGYTHCPDVCPLTLNEFRRIRDSLGDLSENVEYVFVSVDPQRDTPDAINSYFETRKLDGFIGLTGDEVDLKKLGVDYGLFFEKSDGTSNGGYLVDHTAGSYLLNPDGQWIMRYQFGVMPSLIVEDLETFIGA